MKKIFLLFFIVALAPMFLMGQEVIQSFDTQQDTSYWNFESSDNSDSLKSFIVHTLNEEDFAQGTGSMQVEYSVHNSESWGGYTKIEYVAPDSQVLDWSAYDSISFWYNNVTAQTLEGRVHVRFELYDVSDADPSVTNAGSEMEFYYSFQYVLDNEPGWVEWKMPLIDGRGDPTVDEWNGEAFNRTGWSGITGNDQLDTDKIKGWAFEFSISGGGEGDVSAGTILFDAVTLKGSKNALGENPGFEDDLTGWGTAKQAESEYVEVMSDGAYSGDKYLEIGVADNAWAVAYREVGVPITAKEEWKVSAYIKDVSAEYPGGDFAALKMEAKDDDGNIIEAWEDIAQGITTDWKLFSSSHVMPEGATQLTVVLVGTKWTGDGKPAAYGFDDVVLFSLGKVDDIPPEAPTAVNASPNATNHFNLVVWQDVAGESEETYNVYASLNPINSLDDPGVEQVATKVAEDEQATIHYLIYPLKEKELTYYYAVECVDRAGNAGPIAVSSGITNMAEAVASISLNPPASFSADGDLGEWYDSGIMAFEFAPSFSHISVGTFDDDDDLSASVYMAVDDNFLYFAADVYDNVWSFDPAGNFWEDDAIELYIGLYNQVEKHRGFGRGEEPDYKFIQLADRIFTEQFGSQNEPIYFNEDANYEYVDYGGDWSVEVMIPLDSLQKGDSSDDARFHALNGMKVPLDIAFHDSDNANTRDGVLSYSPFNNDNSYLGAENWYYTWVGDTNQVVTAIGEKIDALATSFELKQNYPNPFNPTTTIEYSLAYASKVKVTVFNMLGQELEVLADGKHTAGTHMVSFDATQYASGVYFYQIEADNFVQTRKMLLVK